MGLVPLVTELWKILLIALAPCGRINREVSEMVRAKFIHQDRITIDPSIMVGKPVVRGTRIPVERVLRHLEEHDRGDLFQAFPELTDEDVRACLAFAREVVEVNFKAAS